MAMNALSYHLDQRDLPKVSKKMHLVSDFSCRIPDGIPKAVSADALVAERHQNPDPSPPLKRWGT